MKVCIFPWNILFLFSLPIVLVPLGYALGVKRFSRGYGVGAPPGFLLTLAPLVFAKQRASTPGTISVNRCHGKCVVRARTRGQADLL